MRTQLNQPPAQPAEKLESAAKQVESLILKQLLKSSGAFKASEIAGGGVYADMFAETLADAVSNAGGLGLSQQLVSTMTPHAAAPGPNPLQTPSLSAAVLSTPAPISSGFGLRMDPVHAHPADHHGVDLAAPTGTEIRSAMEGVVVSAGERGGYGNAVEVDHGNGVHTLYAHASELHVREGDKVAAGQVLAEVGQTGKATGPHLHFEVRVHGRAVNPTQALKAYATRAEELTGEGH